LLSKKSKTQRNTAPVMTEHTRYHVTGKFGLNSIESFQDEQFGLDRTALPREVPSFKSDVKNDEPV